MTPSIAAAAVLCNPGVRYHGGILCELRPPRSPRSTGVHYFTLVSGGEVIAPPACIIANISYEVKWVARVPSGHRWL